MKRFIVVIVLISFVVLLKNLNIQLYATTPSSPVEISYRLGPVKLHIDDEWFFKKEQKNYFRVGLLKESVLNDDNTEFDIISPKSMAESTSNETLFTYNGYDEEDNEIIVYDIPIEKNKFWLDLHLIVNNQYVENQKRIGLQLYANKKLFFYHPVKKLWWGLHYNKGSYGLPTMMYEDIYKSTNSNENIKKLVKSLYDSKAILKIINNRTLNLPALKFYDEKFGDFVDEYQLFSWYKAYESNKKIDEDK